jgi:hypothetical protein
MRASTSTWLLALWILVTSVQAGTIFTDTYTHVGHTQDLNSNLAARTFGTTTVTNYNRFGSAWQTQIRDEIFGEVLSLAPRNDPGSPRVWVGPDYDFQSDVGTEYTIIFDVDPSTYSTAWSEFTLGVNAANQGAVISDNHGGLSLNLNDCGEWQLFDGSDASPAAVASGTAAGTGFRTIRRPGPQADSTPPPAASATCASR